VVSIVGYTNAGKSTLLNTLTQSTVYAEDLLFATLETSSRRLRFPREREIIITDTVGFIRDLPKDLVDAFKATLEELEDAHLLLHVVDASDPMRKEQMQAVEKILMDLKLEKIPRLIVLNKVDLVAPEEARMEAVALNAVTASAHDKRSLDALLREIEDHIWHHTGD
jgi:GTPase